MQQKCSGFPRGFVWKPRSTYTIVGEAVRIVLPTHVLCSVCCGGPACKYEGPSQWSEEEQAIKGLYSSWVTDNLLAMARPSTKIMEKYNIIDQFKRSGVKSVINLQRPGEHASCGDPLEPDSGFTYRPETFMENDIYFYNFGWDDYGVVSQWAMLDMVKVMTFAMEEGKMAVHCHAGLGRTGVLMACFLVHATRMTADQAILHVRDKRPNSIQTRGQLWCVREFAKFLVPFRRVFSHAEPWTASVTLSQYLTRQSHMLHGYERRRLKHLPKIIHLVCRLLLDIAENRQVIEEDILEVPDITTEAEMSVHCGRGGMFGTDKGTSPPKGPPRLPGRQPPPRHANEPPIFYHRKALSYSDSDLHRLGSELNLPQAPPVTSLSHDNMLRACGDSKASLAESVSSCRSTGSRSLWEKKMVDSPILKKLTQKSAQRSSQKTPRRMTFFTRMKVEPSAEATADGKQPQKREEEEEKSEVPVLTIQTELSREDKRLLVAQALAVDLQQEGESEHKHRISVWQEELNLQGAWERLCMERDPFVLTALMWLWLEQLREPVISPKAAQSLVPNDTQPQTVLNTLEQAPRQTLVCILDCMAHVLVIPETVEAAFLDRTIKAFTQLEKSSVVGKEVYKILTAILRPVLHDMRRIAVEQDQMKQFPFIPVYHHSP